MPTSDQVLATRLRDTEDALRRQLDAIDVEARIAGHPRELMRDVHGGFTAAPVLVALAQVQVALLAHVETGSCGDESLPGHPGTYRCERPSGHAGQHLSGVTRWENMHA